jgi:hypothetical protein
MPIQLSKKRKAKRGVFTIDLSVAGQGPGPYKVTECTFDTASGDLFPTGSNITLTVTAGGPYTPPVASYTYYLDGVEVDTVTTNTYDFGTFNDVGDVFIDVAITNAGGTSNNFGWTGSIFDPGD